jgi:hypothetical protein
LSTASGTRSTSICFDEKLQQDGIAAVVEEYERDAVLYQKDGLKIIAFEVDLGDFIKPAAIASNTQRSGIRLPSGVTAWSECGSTAKERSI